MDCLARLLAALEGLSLAELRLVLRFAEFLAMATTYGLRRVELTRLNPSSASLYHNPSNCAPR